MDDRGDLGKFVDPFDERIFGDLSEAPRKSEKPFRPQVLFANENYQVVKPRAPNRRDGFAVELLGERDPADLSPQSSSNWADFERIGIIRVDLPARLTALAAPALL